MADSDVDSDGKQHSPRTKGIIQHFVRKVKLHKEGIDNDLQVTNEKLGQLEAAQLATNTKITGLETQVANVDKSLASLLRRLDEFHAKTNKDEDNKTSEAGEDNWDDDYIADTEQDDHDTRNRRWLRTNR